MSKRLCKDCAFCAVVDTEKGVCLLGANEEIVELHDGSISAGRPVWLNQECEYPPSEKYVSFTPKMTERGVVLPAGYKYYLSKVIRLGKRPREIPFKAVKIPSELEKKLGIDKTDILMIGDGTIGEVYFVTHEKLKFAAVCTKENLRKTIAVLEIMGDE
jgi:hypothetical protein